MYKFISIRLLLIYFCLSVPFQALSSTQPTKEQVSSAYDAWVNDSIASLGVNTWGIVDNEQEITGTINFSFAPISQFYDLRPTLFINIGDDSDGYYSLGLSRHFGLTSRWSLGLGFQAGYLKNVESLGYEVEFYSRVFLIYHLAADSGLKLEVGHISNAGFGELNPGSENIGLSYSHYF